jgi:hypothetical protein
LEVHSDWAASPAEKKKGSFVVERRGVGEGGGREKEGAEGVQGIQKQRVHEELKFLTIVCDIVSPQLEEFIFFRGCKRCIHKHTAPNP